MRKTAGKTDIIERTDAAQLLTSIGEKRSHPKAESEAQHAQSMYSSQIFIGVHITGELQMFLSETPLKFEEHQENTLKEVIWNEKKYLGTFIEEPCPPLETIKRSVSDFRKNMISTFPGLNHETHAIEIFPQILLY